MRPREGFFYSPPMPYVFPHEDLFVGVVGFVIVGLLLVRVVIVRRQRTRRRAEPEGIQRDQSLVESDQ